MYFKVLVKKKSTAMTPEREREMLREGGRMRKKVRNGFGVWEASRVDERNFPWDGWVVEHSSTKRQVNLNKV